MQPRKLKKRKKEGLPKFSAKDSSSLGLVLTLVVSIGSRGPLKAFARRLFFFNLLFFWKDNCFTELCCLEKGLMKELFTEVWAQIVKHPGAHNSGRESLVSGPEEVREGALLTNLARLVSMIAGHSTGAVTFTRGTC